MLSPEERSLIDNVQTLVQQLLSMESGEANVAEPGGGEIAPIEQAIPPEEEGGGFIPEEEEEEEEEEEKAMKAQDMLDLDEGKKKKPEVAKVKKELITAKPDASTANSDAEEKVEDIPETDEDNIREVAKQLSRLLGLSGESSAPVRKQVIRKSMPIQPKQQDQSTKAILSALTGLTKVVKNLQGNQQHIASVLRETLEGLGVVEAIEEAYGVTKSQNKPILHKDAGSVLKEIQKMNESEEKMVQSSTSVRKSFRDTLPFFFQQK